jgi:hypothetical protein
MDADCGLKPPSLELTATILLNPYPYGQKMEGCSTTIFETPMGGNVYAGLQRIFFRTE